MSGRANGKRPSFEQACAQYVHRFTMEHVPAWTRVKCSGTAKHYAPQFRSDREWYEHTLFPGEPGHPAESARVRWCYTTKPTWPLGQWLDAPYDVRQAVPS